MKRTLFFISIFNIILFGCMKSQINDSLATNFQGYNLKTITILSDNLEDKNLARCLQRELKEDLSYLEIIPEDQFRNALFPWFEYRTAPKDAAELSALLNKTLVRKHIERLGIELLIYVHGGTHQSDFEGFGGGYGAAAVGYASAERESHIRTTLWDLRKITLVGDTDVHFQGTVHIPIIGIPIVIPAFTESSACSETTKLIYNCLAGEISNKDK